MGKQISKRPIVAPSFTPSANGIATSNIQNGAVTLAKSKVFYANAQTGTGSSQNIAHGLGTTPTFVMCSVTDGGTLTYGTHDATNIKVTCSSTKKFDVIAFV